MSAESNNKNWGLVIYIYVCNIYIYNINFSDSIFVAVF